MKNVTYLFMLLVALTSNVMALEFMGYDLSREENKDILHMMHAVAHISSIVTAESSNSNTVFMGSLIAASATGFKLAQELLHKPQTAVWRQLCVNLPIVGLCIAHLVFDLARMCNASHIAEKNKQLPKSDFKLHQSFCLATELFLRACSWHAKNSAKHENKQLVSALTVAANFVEQWRLGSRWFKMHTGLQLEKVGLS